MPPFVQPCAPISADMIAVDNERQLARLTDPRYRAFLAGLFRMALTEDFLKSKLDTASDVLNSTILQAKVPKWTDAP